MLAFACLCSSVLAQQKDAPSLALLEYLAEMEKAEEGWIGPLDMLEEVSIDAELEAGESDVKQVKDAQPNEEQKDGQALTKTKEEER